MESLLTLDCSYSAPQNYAGAAASSGEPFAFASSSCQIAGAASSTASSTIINSMSSGELVISVYLFVIMLAFLFAIFHVWLRGVKIRQ